MADEGDKNTLASELDSFFRTCVSHRETTGITCRFTNARLQAKSQYDTKTCAQIKDKGEPEIFIPLTSLKLRAQVAWVKDTIKNSKDQLWTLESDAIPELSEASQSEVIRQLSKEFTDALADNLPYEMFDAVASKIVAREAAVLRAQADKHISPMTDLIKDQLHEGGFEDAFDEGLIDLYTHVGILKAPVAEQEQRLVYSGDSGTPKVKEEVVLNIKRVDPFLLYPAPDVGSDLNKGTGVFEQVSWSRSALVAAMDMDAYNKDEIKSLIEKNPGGFIITAGDKKTTDALDHKDDQLNETQDLTAGLYDGFEYHGLIDNSRLKELGLEFDGDEDYGQTEYTAMVCDTFLIYAAKNDTPLKERPYLVCPFYPRGGSWVGETFSTEMIDPHQRIVNAVGRNMILNMAYASGPIGEADTDRIPGGVLPKSVMPRKMYAAETGSHGEKAYRFTELSSHSSEFLQIMQYFFRQTDDFTIPSYVYGSATGLGGSAGLGVATMMFNNASRAVQAVLDNIGTYWLEPLISRYYTYNMIHSDRPEVKGPANVVVKGLSGLLQKEFRRSMLLQGLNLVAPFMNQLPNSIKEEHVARMLRAVLDETGIDPDVGVEDPDKIQRLTDLAEAEGLASTEPGISQPVLDGRSIANPGPV